MLRLRLYLCLPLALLFGFRRVRTRCIHARFSRAQIFRWCCRYGLRDLGRLCLFFPFAGNGNGSPLTERFSDRYFPAGFFLSAGRFLWFAFFIQFDKFIFAQSDLRERSLAVEHSVGNQCRVEGDRPHRIVVTGNHVLDAVRRTICVDDSDDRNIQFSGFADRNVFVIDIDNKQDVGKCPHFLDAAQASLEFVAIASQPQHFFFVQVIEAALFFHLFEIGKPLHGLLDRFVIRQHAAEPAVADKGHITAISLRTNRLSRRTLGADKEYVAAVSNDCLDKSIRFLRHRQALFKIDDVDFVTFAEDVGCHLRVPVTGLMTKVHASLKHLAHGYVCHVNSPG